MGRGGRGASGLLCDSTVFLAKWSGLGSIENIVCVCGLVLSKAHLEGPEGEPARSQMQALVTGCGFGLPSGDVTTRGDVYS